MCGSQIYTKSLGRLPHIKVCTFYPSNQATSSNLPSNLKTKVACPIYNYLYKKEEFFFLNSYI